MQNHFPATVTSPSQQFQRVRFLIDPDAGTLVIRARSGKILKETSGTISPTETGWSMVNDEGAWTLTRDKGCGCGGSKIVDLQMGWVGILFIVLLIVAIVYFVRRV